MPSRSYLCILKNVAFSFTKTSNLTRIRWQGGRAKTMPPETSADDGLEQILCRLPCWRNKFFRSIFWRKSAFCHVFVQGMAGDVISLMWDQIRRRRKSEDECPARPESCKKNLASDCIRQALDCRLPIEVHQARCESCSF